MNNERNEFLSGLPAEGLSYEPISSVLIGRRKIGYGNPCFIIAEIGANHRGNIENALKQIEIAKQAGADAVKFQHLRAEKIAAETPVSFKWDGKEDFKTLRQFYKSSEMPYEWTARLQAHAKKCGVVFLSTPFDKEAVDILAGGDVPAFKVASYEMTDDILLKYIADKKKPIILSTGMAYLEEVAHAIRVIQEAGNNEIILLHCVSMYPPNFEDLNLRAIQTLQSAFKLPVGFSDHSKPSSVAASLGAVALGACVIERHITDEKEGGSRDDKNSLDPKEFKMMVDEIRNLEYALSKSGIKQPASRSGHDFDEIFDRWTRRSICLAKDVKKGDAIKIDDLITLRPMGGIEPRYYKDVVGKIAARDLKKDQQILWKDLLHSN